MNIKEKCFVFYEKYSKLIFIDKPSHLICGICNEIFKYPHQTLCGCIFCFHCLLNAIENGESHCPGKTEDCVKISKKELSFDATTNRKLMKLQVQCPHESCKVIKTLKEIIDHVDECEYRMVKCSTCNGDYQFKNIKIHEDNECPNIQVECRNCFKTVMRQHYTSEHLNPDSDDLCEKYSVNECPNKCSTKGSIDNLREHLKICSKAKQKCPLSTSDCSNCKFNDEELIVHFNENLFQHNQFLMSKHFDMESKFKEIESKTAEIVLENIELESENKEIESKNIELESKIELKNKEIESKNKDIESKNKEIESKNKELESKNIELESKNKEIESKNEKLESKNVMLQSLRESNEELRKKMGDCEMKIGNLECKFNGVKDIINKTYKDDRNKINIKNNETLKTFNENEKNNLSKIVETDLWRKDLSSTRSIVGNTIQHSFNNTLND